MQGPPGAKLVQARVKGYRVPWEEIESIDGRRITRRCMKGDLRKI
jgi:hypothetical protein